MSIKTFALRTPSSARRTFSASFLITAGMFGSFVARASCTFTSPLSILTDLIRPNEAMSRLKPGYFTDFSASRICSSETDTNQNYRGTESSKDWPEPVVHQKSDLGLHVLIDRKSVV